MGEARELHRFVVLRFGRRTSGGPRWVMRRLHLARPGMRNTRVLSLLPAFSARPTATGGHPCAETFFCAPGHSFTSPGTLVCLVPGDTP